LTLLLVRFGAGLYEKVWNKSGEGTFFSKKVPDGIHDLRIYFAKYVEKMDLKNEEDLSLPNLKAVTEALRTMLDDAKKHSGWGKRDPKVDQFYTNWYQEFDKVLDSPGIQSLEKNNIYGALPKNKK
jgi:hypothetical protein